MIMMVVVVMVFFMSVRMSVSLFSWNGWYTGQWGVDTVRLGVSWRVRFMTSAVTSVGVVGVAVDSCQFFV